MQKGDEGLARDEHEEADGLDTESEDWALTPGKERALIRHLPFFVALAENRHFGRAATRLAMSQSALTRRIQSLEMELGVKLFARGRRSARLTEAGQVFYEDSQRILQDTQHAIRRAQKVMQGEAGNLHIAINDGSIAVGAVAETFKTFRARFPEVEIKLHAMFSETQIVALRSEELDVGILYDIVLDKAARRYVDSLHIFSAPLVLVMSEANPLAALDVLTPTDLEHEWFAWFSREGGRLFSDSMLEAFRDEGVTPKIALQVTTEATIINMALANLAVGFVRGTAHLPPSVVARPVTGIDVRVSAHAVWLKKNRKPTLQSFLNVLRNCLEVNPPPYGVAFRS